MNKLKTTLAGLLVVGTLGCHSADKIDPAKPIITVEGRLTSPVVRTAYNEMSKYTFKIRPKYAPNVVPSECISRSVDDNEARSEIADLEEARLENYSVKVIGQEYDEQRCIVMKNFEITYSK